MQKKRQIIGCLTGLASLCLVGGCVMGQTAFEAPQYPQYIQYPQGAPPVVPAVAGAQVQLTAAQIDQLLGPVALYPDPLLSLIFPAATYPQDILAAEQWLATTPSPTEAAIDAQSWDQSVKGLVHYPTVLKMMSDQIDWTQALGAAFLNQQADVMASVQRLRAQAKAAGNLQTTQQEQVVADGDALRIEPADPDTIYVPQYDPNEVYISAYPITYGIGYPIGLWCDDDFDWGQRYIVVGGGWYRGWHHPVAWDQHPPTWDSHPAGWVAAPKPWARAPSRPAPQLTTTVVSRLGLDRPRGATPANPGPAMARPLPGGLPVGRPGPAPSNNAFEPLGSRADVQRATQRAQPVPVAPPRVAPAPIRPAPAPSPVRPAPAPAPVRAAPAPPQRSAPSAFSGGSGGDARAQSQRGNASVGHR
jgi:hypothetical protein